MKTNTPPTDMIKKLKELLEDAKQQGISRAFRQFPDFVLFLHVDDRKALIRLSSGGRFLVDLGD